MSGPASNLFVLLLLIFQFLISCYRTLEGNQTDHHAMHRSTLTFHYVGVQSLALGYDFVGTQIIELISP